MIRKVVFITGTRADYGKLKPLMRKIEDSPLHSCHIFVTGMHLLKKYGATFSEISKDGYRNVHLATGILEGSSMDVSLGTTIRQFSEYVKTIEPDMIIVHGDRLEALAGAIVGAFNNILVAHVEGGEVSGTIDESIRHAVSKLAHLHFVANESAKRRLVQLGEDQSQVFVIGSPDLDIMMNENLPSIFEVCSRYDIAFERYGIFMYHPVTTEYKEIREKISVVINALVQSGKNYVVIYPNNDPGTEIILEALMELKDKPNFRVFPSIRFEYFLTLLKHTDFMIGNSSAGIRETCVYGVPSIDIGSRQNRRYDPLILKNIQHVEEDEEQILSAISHIDDHRMVMEHFGHGKSAELFMEIMNDHRIWRTNLQKVFYDLAR